jgi:hypothetical protein
MIKALLGGDGHTVAPVHLSQIGALVFVSKVAPEGDAGCAYC